MVATPAFDPSPAKAPLSAAATPARSAAASGRAETAAMTRAVRMLAMLFLQNRRARAPLPGAQEVHEVRLSPGRLARRPVLCTTSRDQSCPPNPRRTTPEAVIRTQA